MVGPFLVCKTNANILCSRLPDDLYRVLAQRYIRAHQRQIFQLALRYQQPVEGIRVDVR